MSAARVAAAPLLSSRWYRVAALRPRLDPGAHAQRVSYRREIWHVLVRADGSRSFRLNSAAYAFVGRCDGTLSLQRLWDMLLTEHGDAAPTQDELLGTLARLHQAKLIGFDRKPDFGAQGTVQDAAAPRHNQSLLSFRVALGDPNRWLDRFAPALHGLFTPLALLAWAATVLAAALAAWLNSDLLLDFARHWLPTPRVLMIVWFAYPVVKALHELAHALALKHWGGKVPEWGITILMFTPVPYVDASAATALPRPAQRLLVSAAGIMLELALAAVALAVALNVEPGVVRDTAFAVFFIGTLSTLLVNGNPLLRFDGYHALSDALQLPNLATRSARHWLAWLRGHVLRVPAGAEVIAAAGERPWLWGYAPAAWAYQLIIAVTLVAWLGQISALFGAGIAAYFVWLLAVKPLFRLWVYLNSTALGDDDGRRARRRAAAFGAAALLAIGAVPLPYSSVVQGVVWAPENAQVRAGTEGFIDQIHVRDGEAVRTGQLLFTLRASMLDAETARLAGRVAALETQAWQALRSDPARAAAIMHELDGANAELARVQERIALLQVRAEVDGVAVLDRAPDLPGRFVKQGAVLANLLTGENATVRIALPQEQAALVRADTRSVSVWRLDQPGRAHRAALAGEMGGTAQRLPSAALGDRAGGAIVTDPEDKAGITPAQGIVLADVRIVDAGADATPATATRDSWRPQRPDERIGSRAWVRFDHGFAPALVQAARRAQQLWLEQFNPSQ